MIRRIIAWYDARRRQIDLDILWPICKEHAPNMDHARMAFFLHTMNDRAWTRHYTEQQLIDYVGALP